MGVGLFSKMTLICAALAVLARGIALAVVRRNAVLGVLVAPKPK